MILNLLLLVLILLTTAYLANQGLLSSLLALATAIFSSVLAMALMEPAQGILGKYQPNYARGGTFLLLFLLAFAVTRVVADIAVPKTIKLPRLINRVSGGIVGFITALVVMGTLLLGIEMLPLSNSLLGFDRFPGEKVMQGDEAGEVAAQTNVWFSPDRFVLSIWDGATRGLSGAKTWRSVHPDLSAESYGYRNIVHAGSQRVLPADLLDVPEVWATDNAGELQQRGISGLTLKSGKRVVMARTVIKKGETAPHVSFDSDVNFRVAASQVRLVTNRQRQYYPIGYLDQGRRFVETTLDLGHVVDDYVAPRGSNDAVATEDWVFQIDADEKPALLEMKQLARVELESKVKNSPSAPLAAASYPQHPWLKDLCSVAVTFDPKGAATWSGRVYVLKAGAVHKDVDSPLSSAFSKLEDIDTNVRNGTNGWKAAGQPGVPSADSIHRIYDNVGKKLKVDQDTVQVQWSSVMQVLLYGQLTPNGQSNLETLPRFMENDVVNIWKDIKGNMLVGTAIADQSGKATIERLQPGQATIVYTLQTDKGFYVWTDDRNLAKAARVSLKGVAESSDNTLSIDLSH